MKKRILWTTALGSVLAITILGMNHVRVEAEEKFQTAQDIGELHGAFLGDGEFPFELLLGGPEDFAFKGEGSGPEEKKGHRKHDHGPRGKYGHGPRGKHGHHKRGGFGPFGFFGHRGGEIGKMMSGNIGRMMVLRSELDITEEQKSQLKEIMKAKRPSLHEKMGKMHQSRMALVDAVLAKDANEESIREASKQVGEAITEIALLAADARADVEKVLTDEQKTKIRETFEKNRETRKKMRTKMKEKFEKRLKESEEKKK